MPGPWEGGTITVHTYAFIAAAPLFDTFSHMSLLVDVLKSFFATIVAFNRVVILGVIVIYDC